VNVHKLQEELRKVNGFAFFLEDYFVIFIKAAELFIKTKRQDEDKPEHSGKW
jgi:hypothetical protein